VDSSTTQSAAAPALATPAAGTAPAQGGQPAADPYADTTNLPWNADPRFQQFLNDRKELDTLRQAAEAAKSFEPWKPLIEDLSNRGGFKSFEEFQAAMSQQAEAMAQNTRIQESLTQKAGELSQKVASGEIDKATAARLYEMEDKLLRSQAEAERQNQRLVAVEIDRLKSNPAYEKMDVDYVRRIAVADKSKTLEQHAADSHAREVRREADVIARYMAGKAADTTSTQQTPTNGSAAPSNSNMPPSDPVAFKKWLDTQIAANGGYAK
jgi:hypothetical protein